MCVVLQVCLSGDGSRSPDVWVRASRFPFPLGSGPPEAGFSEAFCPHAAEAGPPEHSSWLNPCARAAPSGWRPPLSQLITEEASVRDSSHRQRARASCARGSLGSKCPRECHQGSPYRGLSALPSLGDGSPRRVKCQGSFFATFLRDMPPCRHWPRFHSGVASMADETKSHVRRDTSTAFNENSTRPGETRGKD